MTNFCLGSDNIDGKEQGYINKMASVLEGKGHSVEKLGVGPNVVQSKGKSSSSKGKTAIFLVGGSDIGTYVDFKDGIGSYYNYKYCWFAFASWTASTWITCEDLKNKALVRAHDDNFSSGSSISPYIGKSADYFFSKNKDKLNYVCGKTPEDLANKILGGGSDSSDDSSKGGGGEDVKTCIQKLLKHWDGDVECYIRGEEVHINKVRDPEEYYSCELREDENVILDSISVTDVNPDTPNHLIVTWTGGKIEFRDERLISRFGEKPKEMEAVNKVVRVVYEEADSDDSDSDSDSEDTSGETT